MADAKIIYLPDPTPTKNKKTIVPKIKKIREITKTNIWVKRISKEDMTTGAQLALLDNSFNTANEKQVFVYSQIKQKIRGYKRQDDVKNKWSAEEFVDLSFVLQLLVQSNLQCFYCKENVFLLYENVRDPKQWTLERVYNTRGHNKDNVEVSCLSCNIKRRTMFHEKFRFTKQIVFQKETCESD